MSSTRTDSSQRRQTKQRTAVSKALANIDDFRSAQQIHDAIAETGLTVGLTTVYRALQAMARDGAIDVLIADDGEARYRRCSVGHHHHLVCRQCGRTVEVAGPTVEAWADHIAAENGFIEPSHTIEITGICSDCVTQAHPK
jgi:Fur family ferric uptake transcriptional regulator